MHERRYGGRADGAAQCHVSDGRGEPACTQASERRSERDRQGEGTEKSGAERRAGEKEGTVGEGKQSGGLSSLNRFDSSRPRGCALPPPGPPARPRAR